MDLYVELRVVAFPRPPATAKGSRGSKGSEVSAAAAAQGAWEVREAQREAQHTAFIARSWRTEYRNDETNTQMAALRMLKMSLHDST